MVTCRNFEVHIRANTLENIFERKLQNVKRESKNNLKRTLEQEDENRKRQKLEEVKALQQMRRNDRRNIIGRYNQKQSSQPKSNLPT